MASAKSSRSRPAYTSGVLLSVPAVNGEDGAQLSDKLQIFKSEGFDPDGYVQSKCQTMSEKEIRHLCAYLQDLKKASAEEMRRSVYANYSAFIQTSKEISDLEGELLSIRNLLSTQVAVIHALADGVHIDSLSSSSEDSKNHILTVENQEPSDVEKWAVEFPDILDVLLAERKVDEALAAFEEGEAKVAEAKEKKRLNLDEISSLKASINSRRQELSDQLAEAACQPSTSSVELRASASALKRLGDGSRGLKLILNGHYQKLRYNMQTIHPTTTSYGGAYTAALSQQVFSAIAHAVKDSLDVFGDDATYSSELVIWATKQTEDFANLVKRHALASAAAAGGLRAAVECVEIAIGHCSLLEARGLSLSSVIMKLFRPSIEQALEANLKRIQQSTAALVAADNWSLTYPSGGTCLSNRSGMISQPKLSSSAHRFYSMVQDFLEDVGPLLSMQLSGSALEGLSQVFSSYVKLLIHLMAVQYLLPLRFLHSNRNSLLFGVSSRNPQRSSTFTSKSSPSLSLSSDREESRWVREEQRWIREEQRWIREEKRWNSERVSLLRQIDFLTTQLERPRQHRDSTKDDYDERKSKHSPLEMEDVKQMVVAARVKEEEVKEEEVKEPRSLKMGSEGDDLIDVSEQQDDYDWKSKHPLLEVEEDAKEVEVEAKERRSLRVGSEGDDVRELQEALQKLGFYSGEEDMEFSSFSTGTERAVKTWQSTLGVHEDGVMSSQLLERLFTGRENDDSQIESDQTVNKLGSLNGVPLVVSIPKIAGTQQSLIKDGGVEDDVTKSRVFLLGENRWEEPSRLVKSVKRTKESNPTTTSAKCLTCRGEGRLMCVECDGTGEPNIEPQFLEWVGEETKCPYCDGLGYIICDACQG